MIGIPAQSLARRFLLRINQSNAQNLKSSQISDFLSMAQINYVNMLIPDLDKTPKIMELVQGLVVEGLFQTQQNGWLAYPMNDQGVQDFYHLVAQGYPVDQDNCISCLTDPENPLGGMSFVPDNMPMRNNTSSTIPAYAWDTGNNATTDAPMYYVSAAGSGIYRQQGLVIQNGLSPTGKVYVFLRYLRKPPDIVVKSFPWEVTANVINPLYPIAIENVDCVLNPQCEIQLINEAVKIYHESIPNPQDAAMAAAQVRKDAKVVLENP